jgi:hypothetical protein
MPDGELHTFVVTAVEVMEKSPELRDIVSRVETGSALK